MRLSICKNISILLTVLFLTVFISCQKGGEPMPHSDGLSCGAKNTTTSPSMREGDSSGDSSGDAGDVEAGANDDGGNSKGDETIVGGDDNEDDDDATVIGGDDNEDDDDVDIVVGSVGVGGDIGGGDLGSNSDDDDGAGGI